MTKTDFNIWQKSFDKSFLFINEQSNVRPDWLTYSEVLKTEYKDSVIKPINKYIYKLCPPPKLVSIEDSVITLCQENFAEIFLLKRKNSLSLAATEKVHVRQFYLSKEKKEKTAECFDQVFNWAMPWFIDEENIDIEISPAPDSPFYFYNFAYKSKKTLQEKIDPLMLFFKFKNAGNHMLDEECGRIKRQQSAYLIKFACSDILVNKIKEFYGKN
jgi:hypothetical protein